MIHQELSLAPHLSVTENVYLGRLQRNRLGFVDYRAMNRKCADQLSLLGIASIGPKQIAKDLSAPQRQVVEIAKALSLDAKLLIMDEPTASLTAGETETLFIVIRKLKAAGVSVIFISHRLQEVFELSDRITVLRDGRHVRTLTNGEASMSEIVGLMVGRDFTKLIQRSLRQYPDGEEPLFEVRHLSSGSLLKDISFKIFRGEVVALTGLVGSGRTELMHSIFGIAPKSAGEILVEGKRVSISSPRSAIAQGLGLVPEERKEQGLFLNMTVKENISMAHLPSLARFLFLRMDAERESVSEYVALLKIKTPGIEQRVRYLSGGNQQKTLFARWLLNSPRLLFLDEPTHGVDVGAKSDIYGIIDDLAARGVGLLVTSSELPEVLTLADRILVMHNGKINGEIPRERATQQLIMKYATNQLN
jgi:ABC-type sugar transport system ATPase subunit